MPPRVPHTCAALVRLTALPPAARLAILICLTTALSGMLTPSAPDALAQQAQPPTAIPKPSSADPATPALSQDCFDELENAAGAEIACHFPLRLSEAEQAELEKGSRGYVKNVTCTMTIRIKRADVAAAIAGSDHVFQSPEQPVTCTVVTYKSTFDVTATFAPRVVFKDDVGVETSPGLANVKGVSRVISWPVVQFVNRWPSIRKGLLQIVNAYRTHARKRAKTAGSP